MPSTPTPSLRLELQQTGEGLNVWGTTLNQDLSLIEQALSGTLTKALTANYTLTAQNYVADEARNAVLVFTPGAGLAAAPTVTLPLAAKSWHVDNRCGFPITFTNGGTTVTVPIGRQADVFSDGANLFMLEPVTAAAAVTEAFANQAAVSATAAASASGTATTARNAAIDNKNYAAEWAVKATDSLISVAAGGNGTSDYSSRHWSVKSAASATASAASATTSSGFATNSSNSATASANSATASATSAAQASASAGSAATPTLTRVYDNLLHYGA